MSTVTNTTVGRPISQHTDAGNEAERTSKRAVTPTLSPRFKGPAGQSKIQDLKSKITPARTPEDRARRAAAQRAMAQAQAEQFAEQQRQFRARLAKITDEEADRTIRALSESDRRKLERFAKADAKNRGLYKIEERPHLFRAAQRLIIKNLMAAGMEIWEIEEE